MKTHPTTKGLTIMKLTRRAARRIELVLATRKAEREAAKPKLNYNSLFDDLIHAVHENV